MVNSGKTELGVVPGRFQIIHNDHLEYLTAAAARCEHLIVGLTSPDPTLAPADPKALQWSGPLHNPLNYFERQALVRAVLDQSGVDPRRISIVPLPINRPDLMINYVPDKAVHFLTVQGENSRSRLELLLGAGFPVEVMWEKDPEEKGLTGSLIRRRMMESRPWQHMVPPVVADLLIEWGIPDRLTAIEDTLR